MLEFDDPNELLGVVLDQRFRLLRVLGQGGLSVVYEGESLEPGPRVAVKILRAEFGERPEIVERFLHELRATARVEHPAVAQVHEAVRASDGTPYLVMELVAGRPLSARMNQGRLPVDQATGIVRSLLSALQAAHSGGVIHRDLKPGNIMLVGPMETTTTVKVLDFGIALVVDAAGGMQRKTRTGMLLGTPGYMSPEQIRTIKTTDPRADLWSVGIILYELLTNLPAFDADNEFARITKVLNSEPTPIEQVAPQYAHWSDFFRRALHRSIDARFQTAEEMSLAVDATARGQAIPLPGASQSPAPAHSGGGGPQVTPSVPPAGVQPSVPPGVQPSVPPAASPSGAPRFGSLDTAVSPGSAAVRSAQREAAPDVRVVEVTRRPLSVPLFLALLLSGMTGALGFALGFWLGRL